jgi:large subunit ribosomal protein L10
MALTKSKKHELVDDVKQLLNSSKLTVVAEYQGTNVHAMQALRRSGEENQTVIKVVKNRLVKKALAESDNFKQADSSNLSGMLLYAFSAEDEIAPAQVLSKFSKTEPSIKFVGAFNADGQFIGAEDVKMLADLPTKDQLRSMLVGTLAAPLTGFSNVMSGSLRGVLYALEARTNQIS